MPPTHSPKYFSSLFHLPKISLSHDDLLSSHSSAAAYSLSVFLSPPLPLLLPISLPRPLQIFNWLCHLLLPWSHSIFISPTFSAPTFQGQIMHKIAHFTSFLHLFAREIYVCLSLLTLGVCQKESESRFSFKHGGKHFDKFFLEGETHKSVALCRKHITLSMWAGWCPLPLLSWWRYCVFWQNWFKILRLVTISGQNQAYAQAALQYAYAPNMLTAQQLTAAGLSYLLSFKMCLGCLYSVVFRNIIARPKRPYPCPSLPSILGLTSPGFPAYAAAAGSNKFHETQFNLTLSGIWIHLFVDTSEFVCQVPLQQGKPTLNSSQQSKESSEKEVRIFFTFLPEERRQLSMDSLYFQGTCNIELVASGKRNNEEEALKTSDMCKVHIAPIHDCIHMYTQSCILCIHIYIQYVYTDIHLFTFSNVTEEDMAFLPKVSLVFLSINVFRT